MSSALEDFSDNLNAAILEQPDPELVRDGAPAYLLLMDSLVRTRPDDVALRESAALLYAAYGVVFTADPQRSARLTEQAWAHGSAALCRQRAAACELETLPYDAFVERLDSIRQDDVSAFYAYTVSWLAYTRTHSDDWLALARLPMIEAALERIRTLDTDYEAANVHLYLGVLNTLRPAALGGKPEVGRRHFERAIELSGGRDLSIMVELARSYARLVYDRELHDRLLQEVLAADPQAPGLTLLNTLAQREAEALLATADEYF